MTYWNTLLNDIGRAFHPTGQPLPARQETFAGEQHAVVKGEKDRALYNACHQILSSLVGSHTTDANVRRLMDFVVALRPMTQFSGRNAKRCESPTGFNHPIHSWDASDWFLATMGELGEAANVAKKLNRIRDGIKGNREDEDEVALHKKLRKEIGDTGAYLDLLATAHGFNLYDAMVEVFEAKSKEIGYEE